MHLRDSANVSAGERRDGSLRGDCSCYARGKALVRSGFLATANDV